MKTIDFLKEILTCGYSNDIAGVYEYNNMESNLTDWASFYFGSYNLSARDEHFNWDLIRADFGYIYVSKDNADLIAEYSLLADLIAETESDYIYIFILK